jgi:hypothetical protein
MAKLTVRIQRGAHALYQKHSRWLPIAFFAGGFLFDMLTLSRIDALATLLQQAVYLVGVGTLVALELVEAALGAVNPPRLLRRVWEYREEALHFLLGSLLSGYALFYFKSASTLTSFAFIAILLGILVANEFLRFGRARIQVHTALLALCLVSFMASLSPILMGFIGVVPFLCGMLASGLVFYLFGRAVGPRLESQPGLFNKQALRPFAAVLLVFGLLYFARVIPPVPLSVRYMGIYHDVQKKDGFYHLSYTRPRWKFWQNGDQTFVARPGDQVFCYVQVFSPARFRDELQIRWLSWHEKGGWQPQDAIPMSVVGGREEGYRGVTKKQYYSPGRWRVQIETRDGREIGRIGFTIEAAEPGADATSPPEVKTELR